MCPFYHSRCGRGENIENPTMKVGIFVWRGGVYHNGGESRQREDKQGVGVST